jgi:hypothetical protein
MVFTNYLYPVQYINTSANPDLNLSIIGNVTWSTTPSYPAYTYDQNITLNLGSLNDTFSFKVPNYNNAQRSNYRLQDKILLYQLLNGASIDPSNLMIYGLVKKIEERTTDSKQKELTISGVSFSEVMTQAVTFADQTNVTCFEFIKKLFDTIKANMPTFPVTWDPNNPLTKKYNPVTKIYDGLDLPKMNSGGSVSYFNWSMDRYLDRFLNETYTGDGRYFWYVDQNNQLCIRKMLQDPLGNITEGVDKITSFNITMDTSDIRNWILVKCGNDANGNPVTTYYYNPVSAAQYGLRYYMIKTTDADDLIQACRKSVSGWDTTSSFPPVYPFILPWNGASVANNKAFNDALRAQAKVQGKNNGEAFANSHNKGWKQVTIELPPTMNWHMGDIISLTFPSYGLNDLRIRVYTIQYTNTSTVLTLKEEYLFAI